MYSMSKGLVMEVVKLRDGGGIRNDKGCRNCRWVATIMVGNEQLTIS